MALQGTLTVGAVLWICRWQAFSPVAKPWLCRLAFLKLPLSLLGAAITFRFGVTALAESTQHGPTNLQWLVAFLGSIWIVGVVIELGILALRGCQAHAFLKRASPVSFTIAASVHEVARRLGWRSPTRIVQVPGLKEPCVMGGWRPTLVVPANFEALEDPLATAHELAHLRCRHLPITTAAGLIAAVFWIIPGVFALERELVLWHEAEADRVAQRALGAKPSEMARRVLKAATTPAFGLSFGAAETERRIHALVGSRPRAATLLLGIAFASVLMIPVRIEANRPASAPDALRRLGVAEAYSPAGGPVSPRRKVN
ncbi:MAG TPA: M56 family metallopeptidase [Fimbriimonadaceae bacterium]|nr:M56 family metallopeptidase [Fimbriimonadaceae bacterium]